MAKTTRRRVLAAVGMTATGISTTMTSHAAADDVERPVEMHAGEQTIIAHDCSHFEHHGPERRIALDVEVSHYLDGEVTTSWLLFAGDDVTNEVMVNCHAEEMREMYDRWDGQGSFVIERVIASDRMPETVSEPSLELFEWPEQFQCGQVVHEDIHPWVTEEMCPEYVGPPLDAAGAGAPEFLLEELGIDD